MTAHEKRIALATAEDQSRKRSVPYPRSLLGLSTRGFGIDVRDHDPDAPDPSEPRV